MDLSVANALVARKHAALMSRDNHVPRHCVCISTWTSYGTQDGRICSADEPPIVRDAIARQEAKWSKRRLGWRGSGRVYKNRLTVSTLLLPAWPIDYRPHRSSIIPLSDSVLEVAQHSSVLLPHSRIPQRLRRAETPDVL